IRLNYDSKLPSVRGRGPVFMNYRYWYCNTSSTDESSRNLMEKLIAGFKGQGNILDVACGYGGTTNYLSKYWRASEITGINLTETQIDYCKEMVPGCNFQVMDAAKLDFEPGSFD